MKPDEFLKKSAERDFIRKGESGADNELVDMADIKEVIRGIRDKSYAIATNEGKPGALIVNRKNGLIMLRVDTQELFDIFDEAGVFNDLGVTKSELKEDAREAALFAISIASKIDSGTYRLDRDKTAGNVKIVDTRDNSVVMIVPKTTFDALMQAAAIASQSAQTISRDLRVKDDA